MHTIYSQQRQWVKGLVLAVNFFPSDSRVSPAHKEDKVILGKKKYSLKDMC